MGNPPNDTQFIQTALHKLEEETGYACGLVEGPASRNEPGNPQPDAWVEIQANSRPTLMAARVKGTIDRTWVLDDVNHHLAAFAAPGLLVTRHLTPELARHCKRIGLQFIDAAGNAFLREPGMLVQITGQRPEVAPWKETRSFRIFDRTGLKVLYAFNCFPDLLNAPYREIASVANVGLGTVAEILADLRRHGYLVDAEKSKRRLLNQASLRQSWVESFPIRLRGKLQAQRFTAPDPEWWKEARPREQGAYWGGEVAAAKLTGYLVPGTCTLYTHEDPKLLILRHRLRPDPLGTVEILKAFWDPALPQGPPPHEDLVHPLLVEADLKAIDDPRTNETARMIHDRFLT